jgi:hypothetical protein
MEPLPQEQYEEKHRLLSEQAEEARKEMERARAHYWELITELRDLDGQKQSEVTYKAHYFRYSKKYEEECDTLEEAITFLAYSLYDSGQLSPVDIVGPDGTVVLEGEELSRRMMVAYGD